MHHCKGSHCSGLPDFDYSFKLRKIANTQDGGLFDLLNPFGSLIGEALNTYQLIRRFKRRWTEEQFIDTAEECLKAGYAIVDVFKKLSPKSGIPQGVSIENDNLYERSGLSWKLRK